MATTANQASSTPKPVLHYKSTTKGVTKHIKNTGIFIAFLIINNDKKRKVFVTHKKYTLCYLLPLFLLTSFATQAKPEYTWKKDINYVATSTLKGAKNNNHPNNIAIEKIARILSQVNAETASTKRQAARVFSDSEIDLLAHKINEALQQVKPHEVIKFSVSSLRSSLIGRKRLSNSGTVFIKNNTLNLILGGVQKDLLAKKLRSGITGTYGRIKNDLATGSIIHAPKNDWKLTLFNGATYVNNRTDWIAIDLSQGYEYAVQKAPEKPNKQKYLTEKQKIHSKDKLEARIEKLEKERIETTPQTTNIDNSIEARLRKLKALYDTGALPETIYLEKVRAIMAEL